MMEYTNTYQKKPNNTFRTPKNGSEMVVTRGWWWDSDNEGDRYVVTEYVDKLG